MRATTEKADEMIRSLDGCIAELEAGMLREPYLHRYAFADNWSTFERTDTLGEICFRESVDLLERPEPKIKCLFSF